jgi:sodium/proline symporter
MSISTPTLITFVIYIGAMLLIGFVAYRATKNFDDYILGGRSLGSFVTALSAGASDMSGWLLMGLPGAIFVAGLSESWIAIGLIAGAWLNWLFVAGRLRVHTERNKNALTLPDYFSHRFEDESRTLRIFSALVVLVFFTIYCASGVVAGARLFESSFGIPYDLALWIGAAATILYVFIGGFLAVSWTDTVQATLMIFALLITPVFVILALGDMGAAMDTIATQNPAAFDMFNGLSFVAIVSLLAWGLGYFGQPHILVRFMAADSVKTIPNARRIGMAWMILTLAGAVAVGFFGIAYFAGASGIGRPGQREPRAGVHGAGEDPVQPMGCRHHPFRCSGCRDEYAQRAAAGVLQRPDARLLQSHAAQERLADRTGLGGSCIMVLLIAFIALGIASNPDSKVLGLVSYAWAGFGAAFGPVVLISLLWKNMTRNGALAGMVVGAITVVVWKEFIGMGLYEIIPGFILASLAIVIFSKVGAGASPSMIKRFEDAESEYQGR